MGEQRDKDTQAPARLPGQGEPVRAKELENSPVKENLRNSGKEVQMDGEDEDIGIYLDALEGRASAQEISLLKLDFENARGEARVEMAARIRKLAAVAVKKPLGRKALVRQACAKGFQVWD